MARRDRAAARLPAAVVRFGRDEDGKVAIVSIFAVLAIGGMIGLIVNTGQTVREKVELQTAADAAATTTTLWMARSMNAVTTANHLMGEATAVTVLLDGFAGPRYGRGAPAVTDSGRIYLGLLNGLKATAAVKPIGMMSPLVAAADEVVVNRVVGLLTKDQGRTSAGGMLYDARMTLKYVATVCLTVKTFANMVLPVAVGFESTGVLAPIGLFLEGIALGTHGLMSVYLGKVGWEWVQLAVVERAVAVGCPPVDAALTRGVLPGLSRYADIVVGSAGVPGGTNRAIRQALDALAAEHRLASLEIVPPVERLRLPVEREPPPDEADGSQPPRGWKGTFEVAETREVRRIYGDLTGAVGKAIGSVGGLVSLAGALIEGAGRLLSGGKPPAWATAVRKAGEDLEDLLSKRPPLPKPPDADGFRDNPSFAADQLPSFDWRSERRSQWARATHPYVDDYRGPIVNWLRERMPLSNAATYYVNWTNRFTLVRAHRLRSDAERTHMHVVSGMLPEAKGDEPWVTDDQAARDLFAVVAVATRKPSPNLLPRIFGAPRGEQVAVAGGLLYNGNGNRVDPESKSAFQPDTGWDTLNWAIPVQAPEWGVGKPTVHGGDAFAVFKKSKPVGPGAAVRLNWQGKLVPVDRELLGRAQGDPARFIIRHERLLRH